MRRVEERARISPGIKRLHKGDEGAAELVGSHGVKMLVVVEVLRRDLEQVGFGVDEVIIGNAISASMSDTACCEST